MKKILLLILTLSTLSSAFESNKEPIKVSETQIDSSYIILGLGFSTSSQFSFAFGLMFEGSDIGGLMNIKGTISDNIDPNVVYPDLSKDPFDESTGVELSTGGQINLEMIIRMNNYFSLNPIVGWGYIDYYNQYRDPSGILSNGDDYYYTPSRSVNYGVIGVGVSLQLEYFYTLVELEFASDVNPFTIGFTIGCMLGY